MTKIKDIIPDHVSSNDVIVIGMSPSPRKLNKKPYSNSTLVRLDRWMKAVDQREWSFHNVIPNVVGSSNMDDVDVSALKTAVRGKKIVIALGSFVERVCKKYGIDNFKIDHPSPRNRNFNDHTYEAQMLSGLKNFLNTKYNQ